MHTNTSYLTDSIRSGITYLERDDTLVSKLDSLKITYTNLINCYTRYLQIRDVIDVSVDLYTIDGSYVLNLICEGFSLAVKFNDASLPDCYIMDTDSCPLEKRFANVSKALDRRIANFYQDLKDVNNHLQQLI